MPKPAPSVLFLVWDQRYLNEKTCDEATCLSCDENSLEAARDAYQLGGVVFEHKHAQPGSTLLDAGVFRPDLSPPPHGQWTPDVAKTAKKPNPNRTESDHTSRNRKEGATKSFATDPKTRKRRDANRANDGWSNS